MTGRASPVSRWTGSFERHAQCAELRLALLQREDLPLDVRRILLAGLATSLCELIVSRGWMRADRADAVTRDARDRATITAALQAPAEHMPGLVRQLMEAGELTPAFLIRVAVSGHTLLLQTALSVLADVPASRVAALIASGRAVSLKAVLRQAGLPPTTFPVFSAAVDAIRSGDAVSGAAGNYRRATQLLDCVIARYQQRPDRELDKILALLRGFAAEAKRLAARGFAEQIRRAA